MRVAFGHACVVVHTETTCYGNSDLVSAQDLLIARNLEQSINRSVDRSAWERLVRTTEGMKEAVGLGLVEGKS